MATKIIKSASEARKLVSVVRDLYDLCDVEIRVGKEIFKCHKLVLTMQSEYFQERFLSVTVNSISIDDVNPEDFRNVLNFFNVGEIELNPTNVVGTHNAFKLFRLDGLKDISWQYVKETVDIGPCVDYWKAGESEGDSELQRSCLDMFVEKFIHVSGTTDLKDVPQMLMKQALERDDLNVKNEEVVCEILLKWFDANRVNWQHIQPLQLLSLVRWSGVSIDCLTSEMICNNLLKSEQHCLSYLSRVLHYRLTGTQFPGLLSHHRRSTGLETCVVLFGTVNHSNDWEGIVITRRSFRVSLQRKNSVQKISDLPSTMQPSASACVNNNSVYVTGLGFSCKKTWRWDSIGGWARCGDMVEGRRRHFTTFINSTSMYALGGFADLSKTTLSSVEQFNTIKNTWTTVGQLAKPIDNAGGAAYKSSIYLFGGGFIEKATNKSFIISWIQQYNTTSEQCTILKVCLPRPQKLLRAVPWEESVILMGYDTCLIFNFENQTLEQRDRVKFSISQFGLVIDNQMLFLLGGRRNDNIYKEIWCIPVVDVISNKSTATWVQHGSLKARSKIHSYAMMTLAAQ